MHIADQPRCRPLLDELLIVFHCDENTKRENFFKERHGTV